jgi:hypothetical protein
MKKMITTNLTLDNDDRIASGSIVVTDYQDLIGSQAEGSITVLDYEQMIGTQATAEIVVADYESLDGATFTINGTDLVEGVGWTAGTSNNATATSLASAINALTGIGASASTNTITITATAKGVAGNAIRFSVNQEGLTLPVNSRLEGGQDSAKIVIGTDELVEGTDFTAETDNDTTATNIATAIDGLSDFSATATDNVVEVEADDNGEAFNLPIVFTPAHTVEVVDLAGGTDDAVITFNGVDYVQGVDFDAETSNDVTATNIASELDDDSDFTATATTNTVDIVADDAGLAGNTGLTANKESLVISPMSGGADFFYSNVIPYDNIQCPTVLTEVLVGTTTGGAKVTAGVEVSFTGDEWVEVDKVEDLETTDREVINSGNPRNFARVRLEVDTGTAEVQITQQANFFFSLGDEITYPFTFGSDLTVDGNLTVGGNTSVGPITADSLFVDGNIDLPNEVALRGRNSANNAWLDLIQSIGNQVVAVGDAGLTMRISGNRINFPVTGSTTATSSSRSITGLTGGDSINYNARTNGTHEFTVNGVDGLHIKAGGIQNVISAVSAEDINWDSGTIHTKTISANTTFTMSNLANGQGGSVLVTNSGTHTVDWTNPSGLTIEWAGGVVPVQTHNGKDLYLFDRVGTVIIARVIQDIK